MDVAFTFLSASDPADVKLDGPDLASEKDLETAVIVSIFTDRRADPDDPIDSDDRRGWWGDSFPFIEGDKIGSRLWELAREKQTQQTLNRAQQYLQEALAWLVDDDVAENVTVECEWVRMGWLGAQIDIYKPNAEPIRFNYKFAWDQLNAV